MSYTKCIAVCVFASLLVGCGRSPSPTPTPAPTPAPETLAPALISRIDSLAEAVLQQLPLAGITVGVRQGDRAPFVKAYGYADIEKDVPTGIDTVYPIASLSKQFTAAAVLQLVEQGKVNLDQPISQYLPGLPGAWGTATVDQLLHHTSGVPDYARYDPAQLGIDITKVYTPGALLSAFKRTQVLLDFDPGSQFLYSNTGYFLLGMLVEKVTGLAYGDSIAQRVAAPAGLTATAYCDPPPASLAQGYLSDYGNLAPAPLYHASIGFSAGGLCSTAGDLLAWQQALAGGRVVSPASYREMVSPGTLNSGRSTPYGYGLYAGARNGRFAIYHQGALAGYLSSLTYYPQDDVAIVLLANTSTPPFSPNPLDTLEQLVAASVLAQP